MGQESWKSRKNAGSAPRVSDSRPPNSFHLVPTLLRGNTLTRRSRVAEAPPTSACDPGSRTGTTSPGHFSDAGASRQRVPTREHGNEKGKTKSGNESSRSEWDRNLGRAERTQEAHPASQIPDLRTPFTLFPRSCVGTH